MVRKTTEVSLMDKITVSDYLSEEHEHVFTTCDRCDVCFVSRLELIEENDDVNQQ